MCAQYSELVLVWTFQKRWCSFLSWTVFLFFSQFDSENHNNCLVASGFKQRILPRAKYFLFHFVLHVLWSGIPIPETGHILLANKVHLFREGHKKIRKKSPNFICCCFVSLKKEIFFQIYVAFSKYVDFTNAHVLTTQHIFMFGLML